MGCHIWCYTPANIPEKEECRKELIEKYVEYYIPYFNSAPFKNILKNRVCKLKENKVKYETMLDWYFEEYGFCKENGKYYEQTEFHDIFRCSDYDAKPLFSLKETLTFIEQNKEICYGNRYFNPVDMEFKNTEINFEYIKEFWSKYPDGLITFG